MRKRRRFFTNSTTFDVSYLLDNSPTASTRHKNGKNGVSKEDIEKALYNEWV